LAWIFYFPFILLMSFMLLNITVSIIGESYAIIRARLDPTEIDKFEGAPSELRKGEPTSVRYQLQKGLRRRMQHLLWGHDPNFISKDEIIVLCQGLEMFAKEMERHGGRVPVDPECCPYEMAVNILADADMCWETIEIQLTGSTEYDHLAKLEEHEALAAQLGLGPDVTLIRIHNEDLLRALKGKSKFSKQELLKMKAVYLPRNTHAVCYARLGKFPDYQFCVPQEDWHVLMNGTAPTFEDDSTDADAITGDSRAQWLIDQYDIAVNNKADLGKMLHERIPPPPTPNQLMSQFEVAVENIVTNQTQIHSRVDYLISLLVF
jgi:hypothetical protein